MLTQLTRLRRRLQPKHLLSGLFLIYILLVALAALPEFLYQLGGSLYWETGYSHLIETVDTQYEGMLTTEKEQPLLQNKGTYINFNGFMSRALRQPMMNERVMMNNGHLGRLVSTAPEPEQIRQAADNIIRFCNSHTAAGGDFLFVMIPSQISKYEELLPTGYSDPTNATSDVFLTLLDEGGVPFLDLREEMQKEGISVTDAFYVTDHHWTPQAGFWAYGKIMDKLAEIQVISPVDAFYTDAANYTFETYENTFLGSSGKRTGIYYAGLDDSVFIKPNFDTAISVAVPERELELHGRFEKVAYNTEAVHNFEDPDFYQENAYGLYGWGDTKITHWRNANAPEQGRFLLIGESFGNIPFSLMSIALGNCDEMDLRYYDGDFKSYYETYAPDSVIVEVNVDMTLSEFTSYPYLG